MRKNVDIRHELTNISNINLVLYNHGIAYISLLILIINMTINRLIINTLCQLQNLKALDPAHHPQNIIREYPNLGVICFVIGKSYNAKMNAKIIAKVTITGVHLMLCINCLMG